VEQGRLLTAELAQRLQATCLPAQDYASRYHSLPEFWREEFLNALELHPQRAQIEASLETLVPCSTVNWSQCLPELLPYSSGSLVYDDDAPKRSKGEALTTLQRVYQSCLEGCLAAHKRVAVLSAFLPILGRQVALLDRKIEAHAQLSQRAIQNTVQMLLQHENKSFGLSRRLPSHIAKLEAIVSGSPSGFPTQTWCRLHREPFEIAESRA